MILHGIESPTLFIEILETNIQEIQNKDRVDVILANPPFGGKEKTNIQRKLSCQDRRNSLFIPSTLYKKLKVGGRCGVVIKNTFLSNTDNASTTENIA